MKKFDLQVNNRTFEIEFIYINREGSMYNVYERIEKKHWWSSNVKYLFSDIVITGENIKATISESIKDYLSKEADYSDFLKQISEL